MTTSTAASVSTFGSQLEQRLAQAVSRVLQRSDTNLMLLSWAIEASAHLRKLGLVCDDEERAHVDDELAGIGRFSVVRVPIAECALPQLLSFEASLMGYTPVGSFGTWLATLKVCIAGPQAFGRDPSELTLVRHTLFSTQALNGSVLSQMSERELEARVLERLTQARLETTDTGLDVPMTQLCQSLEDALTP